MYRMCLIVVGVMLSAVFVRAAAVVAPRPAPLAPNRPRVAGELELRMRTRVQDAAGRDRVVVQRVRWKAAETAIVVCDMWDDHYCKMAAHRVDAMAPRMNRVLTAARNQGVMVVHAPSGCMDKYAGTPFRLRMQQAKSFEPPVPIGRWCYLNPKLEPPMPVDTSKCACDDPVVGPKVRRYSRQHAAIKIAGYDGVSDRGPEIYNCFRVLGIRNVVLMGVHTNMCVLGRPFGIRQMKYLKMNVVLARDLTDAMYDPRQPPYVSHARGTELVIEHIEKHWCPSIVGLDLTRVVPGTAGPEPGYEP